MRMDLVKSITICLHLFLELFTSFIVHVIKLINTRNNRDLFSSQLVNRVNNLLESLFEILLLIYQTHQVPIKLWVLLIYLDEGILKKLNFITTIEIRIVK